MDFARIPCKAVLANMLMPPGRRPPVIALLATQVGRLPPVPRHRRMGIFNGSHPDVTSQRRLPAGFAAEAEEAHGRQDVTAAEPPASQPKTNRPATTRFRGRAAQAEPSVYSFRAYLMPSALILMPPSSSAICRAKLEIPSLDDLSYGGSFLLWVAQPSTAHICQPRWPVPTISLSDASAVYCR